jgi:hypothetical protein
MKNLPIVLVLLVPLELLAQNAFEGTWRIDPRSSQSSRTEQYSLQNGVYRCDSCVPKVEVKADGQDHSVTGNPYRDTINIRVLDDRSIEIASRKEGKVIATSKVTASEDGKTLTTEWSFETGGSPGSGNFVYVRSGPAPAGAHKVSGTWKLQKFDNPSDSVLTFTFKSAGDGLSRTDQFGDSYTAKFDGKDYPAKGDPGVTTVALNKVDANTIVETDKRDGNVIYVIQMKVSPDGGTMTLRTDDKLHGSTDLDTARKQ